MAKSVCPETTCSPVAAQPIRAEERPDGCCQVLGRVGSGVTDQERRDWLCDLRGWVVGSDYTEANDGLAYRMVWPRHVIELRVLDVIAQTTRGQPIRSMCLDWQAAEGEDRAAGSQAAAGRVDFAAVRPPPRR